MLEKEFEPWFEQVKESATNDFGFTKSEVSSFAEKNWKLYHKKGFDPFYAVTQYLKDLFKHQNG